MYKSTSAILVKLLCGSSSNVEIYQLSLDGTTLSQSHHYEQIIDTNRWLKCTGRGSHIIWEYSEDGITYTPVQYNWYDPWMLEKRNSDVLGVLITKVAFRYKQGWKDMNPYVTFRCRVVGFQPFSGDAMSEPVKFLPG